MQRVFHPLRSRKATPIRAADLATPQLGFRPDAEILRHFGDSGRDLRSRPSAMSFALMEIGGSRLHEKPSASAAYVPSFFLCRCSI